MHRTLSRVAALVAVSAGVVIASAPQAQPPTFVAGNKTVAVYATVTNARGRLMTELTKEDFSIDDNGKKQTLTLFANEIQPITMIMLLDRSGSMKPNLELEEKAAEAFVRAMLPADRVRIGSFAKYIQIDPEDFTSDKDKLIDILRNDLQKDGPTPLWNAVDRGIDKLLIEQGRRVILVFTDGVDEPMDFSGHHKSLKDVMKRAEEENVMVYAIGLAGQSSAPNQAGRPDPRLGGMNPGAFGSGPGGRGISSYGKAPQLEQPDEGLPKIAAATGGGYFELTSPNALSSTFAKVAEELHHQYTLGFTPEKLDGKMHELTLHLSMSDLTGRARKRYLASK